MPKGKPVERALATLQAAVRRRLTSSDQAVTTEEVPDDLQSEDFRVAGLPADGSAALEKVRSLLSEDLRFEHLKDAELKHVTWRFVCLAHLRPGDDLVPEFVHENAQEPVERTCYFPVELLTVKEELELFGVRLLPVDAVERPPTLFSHDPGPPTGSIIAVECTGTNREKMSTRARAVAERALRLMRATFREEPWMPDPHLRFRLGPVWWFDDSIGAGRTSPRDEGWELELDDGLLHRATSQQISTLPNVPSNDIETRAERALEWYKRAQLAVDPIVELLYLFFALETILGVESEGLKAHALALRRAMLGLVTSSGFTPPSRTYFLYDEVRSTAVHGEAPKTEISQREVTDFAWDVRRALNEFLEFARSKGLTKRAQVRRALDSHERRESLDRRLLRDDPKLWSGYLKPEPEALAKRWLTQAERMMETLAEMRDEQFERLERLVAEIRARRLTRTDETPQEPGGGTDPTWDPSPLTEHHTGE
jgi:hypothetical protein